jgi:hypothetical protein
MSTKLVSFSHKVNDVLTDATSVKFSDPTGVFGLRREDDHTIVVADGTDLDHDDTGLYSYTVTGLAAGITYEYWIEWVYNGATRRVDRTFVAGAISPTTYGTRAGIEGIYGTTNVSGAGGYADVNDNGDAVDIDGQIDRARQHAYDWINSKLRGAGLTAPATADNFTEFGLLDDIENERAGAWLYFKRGKNDNDPNGAAQMQWHWDNAERELDRIIAADDDSAGEVPGSFGFIRVRSGCWTDEYAQ